MSRLFCFGLGFSARVLGRRLLQDGWSVVGTSRSDEGCAKLEAEGFEAVAYDGKGPLPNDALDGVSHLVASVPPDEQGDPVLRHHATAIEGLGGLQWVGYLSTTGVYGNRDGGWVDEDTPVAPDVARSMRRAEAEQAWLHLKAQVHIFRLAGIYGPGRSAVDQVLSGKAKRVVKPGQVFCRTHVEDIAQVLRASMDKPNPGRIYNICDDEPAPPQDVVACAAHLLGMEPPPEEPFETAQMSPMARSFYADNRRVRNDRVKVELGVRLKYPTYREGLQAVVDAAARR